MPTNKQLLTDFVSLGQEILQCDWTTHYGKDASRVAPSLGYAQPGLVGGDYSGLVVVGQNPGVGNDDFSKMRREVWKPLLRAWRDEGTFSSYAVFYQTWRTVDLPQWRYWKDWVWPFLSRISFNEEHVGMLNLVKNQTRKNHPPTVGMFRADWSFTRRQLEILEPKVVVGVGLRVGQLIRESWPHPPFELIPLNRVQGQSKQLKRERAGSVAEQVAAVLGLQ